MAQMSVPAEPSYKTTSYNGLRGADFSSDTSQVANNHSPDLLNLISDYGGLPLKRKGWEIFGTTVADKPIKYIWHFQMFGKKWGIAVTQTALSSGTSTMKIHEITSSGVASTALGTVYGLPKVHGFFFNAGEESKTGFYLVHSTGMSLIRPANASSTTLTMSAVSATVPTITEHRKYDGTDGVSTEPVNMLTRKMTFSLWDDRTNDATREYVIFNGSGTTIASVDKVELLDSNGDWNTVSSGISIVSNTKVKLTNQPLIIAGSAITDNVRITITASTNDNITKLAKCTCSTIFSIKSNGVVMISGNPDYPQYVWFSDIADPTYFPDVNYLFVGGEGTSVKGLMPLGSQVAVLKEPSASESTVYLLTYAPITNEGLAVDGSTYSTTQDTFSVVHGLSGIGCISEKTTFPLNDEPLFLSQHGITGLVSSAITSTNSVKNRSGFLDSRLLREDHLEDAVAVVHKNYYMLVVNTRAYILDARQKMADSKNNSSFFYESYYWENIPAIALSSDGETLWFGTEDGNICRFKNSGQLKDYADGTVYGDDSVTGTAIHAVWSTPYDNDGLPQYYKTLQKKGTGATFVPYTRSTISAYFQKDGEEKIYLGDAYVDVFNWLDIDFDRFTFVGGDAPRDAFFKKKMKKYKRLKIILENNKLNEGFGVQEIFKTYAVTQYAKK